MKEHKAEKRFTDINTAVQQYFLVTGRQLEPLPPKPVLYDFYVPSEDRHNRELAFITLSMTVIGAFCGVVISMSYNYNYVHLHWKRFGRQVENVRNGKHFIKKYNEYHQIVHEISHMSDLHIDSSFHKQSIKELRNESILQEVNQQ